MQKPKKTAHLAVLKIVQEQINNLSQQDKAGQALLFDLKEVARFYQRIMTEQETEETNARATKMWNHMEQLRHQLKRHGCNLNVFNLEEVIPALLKMNGENNAPVVQREFNPIRVQVIPSHKQKPDIWERVEKALGKRN